jgi:hypothetical protein
MGCYIWQKISEKELKSSPLMKAKITLTRRRDAE